MKKILCYTFSLLFASLFFASCEQESLLGNEGEGVKFALRLSSNDLQSRTAGDDYYNENSIKKVDIYLYPAGGVGNALYKISDTFENTTGTAELTVTLDNLLVESLFGENVTSCHAYALVNYNGTAPAANTPASTIANLKALEITPNSATASQPGTFATCPQPSFVMDGESSAITYNKTNRSVSGTIKVKRAASKISLSVTSIEKTITDAAGNIWEPDYNAMRISFHNGVNKSKVDEGYLNNRPVNTLAAGNTYGTDIRTITAAPDASKTTDQVYALTSTHAPFYSYSYDWINATDTESNPTITIMVPWRKITEKVNGEIVIIPENERQNKSTWQTCYYQIPVNAESKNGSLADCLERNMYYSIKLHVGILGDFNPASATEITASYYTVPWQGQDVDVDIKNYKYLVVDKNDVTVYNENEVRIGYASSNPINAEITYIRRPDYSQPKVDTTRFYGSLSSQSGTTSVSQGTNSMLRACTVSVEGNEIVLNHDIVNKSTQSGSNYDFVPYYIWVKVTMTVQVNNENRTFTEWIRYEQYPAIYIVANQNSDFGEAGEEASTTATSTHADWNDNRNLFVNGYWTNGGMNSTDHRSSVTNGKLTGSYQDIFGTATGLNSDFKNINPNMYVVHVTAMSDGKYMIGDPRERTLNQSFIESAKWVEAPAIYDESPRKLRYYYRTDTSGSKTPGQSGNASDYTTGNVIAPVFRIASSYSVTSGADSHAKAEKRCASYQEDGYPAGRWRMPTFAEIEFICTLSSESKIPALFASGIKYWCAHGVFSPSTSGVTLQSGSSAETIRCVYDEWYWGSEQIENKNTFTWGDSPR